MSIARVKYHQLTLPAIMPSLYLYCVFLGEEKEGSSFFPSLQKKTTTTPDRRLQLTWYNSLWLRRWPPHGLLKRQSISTTLKIISTHLWFWLLCVFQGESWYSSFLMKNQFWNISPMWKWWTTWIMKWLYSFSLNLISRPTIATSFFRKMAIKPWRLRSFLLE